MKIFEPLPFKQLSSYGLKYETTPHTTFLCLAISWSIFGVKSKLIVFWKAENLAHRSSLVVEPW